MDMSTVIGNVQRSVQFINATTGASGADYGSSLSAQHGTAEQGLRPRSGSHAARRERGGRARGSPSHSQRSDNRMQNLQDLEGIVETIHDRLDTAERLIRLQAQSIAHLDETGQKNRAISKSIHDDFIAYKTFITTTHGVIDNHVTEQVNLLNAKIESIHASFAAYTDVIPTRIQVIEDTLTAMSMDRGPMPGHEYGTLPPPAPPGIPGRQVPESFTVHTPVQAGPEVPDYIANDP